MSCNEYKTANGLQIGGLDPNLVEKAVISEPKTEEIPLEDKTPVATEKEEKAVKKTVKKPVKKTASKKR